MKIKEMEESKLSTKDNWGNYWKNKEYSHFVSHNFSYGDFIRRAASKVPLNSTCIELGGFPGKFSVFLKKYCYLKPTLIDYYFDKLIFDDLIRDNGLNPEDIKVINEDIFLHKPVSGFDLVCSFGLIEHFTDLRDILNVHTKYLNPNGILLISLPNFRGVNGFIQRLFDPKTLSIHNLSVMDIKLLENALKDLGMRDIEVIYYPSTQVWLENLKDRGLFLNLLLRVLDKLMTWAGILFGKQNKFISNSIILMAKSSNS